MRLRRDLYVFEAFRAYFYTRFLITSHGVIEFKEIKYKDEKDLTRLMFNGLARTLIEDNLQKKQISKYCLESMPVTKKKLRETASKMNIWREYITATRIYGTNTKAETFQDKEYIHEIFAYNEEQRTVNLHDALISIVLCIFYPFTIEGMNVDDMDDKAKRTRFHRITGKVLEDALSIIYGTFHAKTEEKTEDLFNHQSLYNRIASTCPDSKTRDVTLHIIDKVFHFAIEGTKEKDISYFYEGNNE